MKNDIGKKVWHRIFGWCTITHPYTPGGTTLVDSEHKHIQHYVSGKGWVDYIGTGKDGNIIHLHIHKDELFDEPQTDDTQAAIKLICKILK